MGSEVRGSPYVCRNAERWHVLAEYTGRPLYAVIPSISAWNKLISKKPQSKGAASANTIRLHRVFAAKPDKLYRAFIEPDAVASWLPPCGFTCTVHTLEAKEGGKHRMSFRNVTTGKSHAFGGSYLKPVPGELLVYTDAFDDPNLPGEMKVSVTLCAVSVGTEMTVVQENVPSVIPAEACYLGWQESLQKLATLVEPDIKG